MYYRKAVQIPEYEAVDLGLPSGLLWAKKNIGAKAEEDTGLYFQWGMKFYRKNDHSKYIFVPAGGEAHDSVVLSTTVSCFLWSSSLNNSITRNASGFCFHATNSQGSIIYSLINRCTGMPIRSVTSSKF